MKSQEKEALHVLEEGETVMENIALAPKTYIWGMTWDVSAQNRGPLDNWIDQNAPKT